MQPNTQAKSAPNIPTVPPSSFNSPIKYAIVDNRDHLKKATPPNPIVQDIDNIYNGIRNFLSKNLHIPGFDNVLHAANKEHVNQKKKLVTPPTMPNLDRLRGSMLGGGRRTI